MDTWLHYLTIRFNCKSPFFLTIHFGMISECIHWFDLISVWHYVVHERDINNLKPRCVEMLMFWLWEPWRVELWKRKDTVVRPVYQLFGLIAPKRAWLEYNLWFHSSFNIANSHWIRAWRVKVTSTLRVFDTRYCWLSFCFHSSPQFSVRPQLGEERRHQEAEQALPESDSRKTGLQRTGAHEMCQPQERKSFLTVFLLLCKFLSSF